MVGVPTLTVMYRHVNKSLLVFRGFGYQHTATKGSNDRYIDATAGVHGTYAAIQKTPGVDTQSVEQ